MTVKEVIEQLREYDPDAPCYWAISLGYLDEQGAHVSGETDREYYAFYEPLIAHKVFYAKSERDGSVSQHEGVIIE